MCQIHLSDYLSVWSLKSSKIVSFSNFCHSQHLKKIILFNDMNNIWEHSWYAIKFSAFLASFQMLCCRSSASMCDILCNSHFRSCSALTCSFSLRIIASLNKFCFCNSELYFAGRNLDTLGIFLHWSKTILSD